MLLLRPLPSLNVRFACAVTVACTHTSDEDIDVPYGEPVELCEDLIAGKDTVFGAVGRIRSWRVPSWHVRPSSQGQFEGRGGQEAEFAVEFRLR
ncbi:hypothetical protein OV320_0519 [Actinobacteria bacterium OV320]|nr:hypothetical protein OV320_0519 [Actinobacteria bacterium OV320]